MRVAESFRKLFEGLIVPTVTLQGDMIDSTIQYGAGDQKELNRWTNLKNQNQSTKYPLLWYPLGDFRVNGNWLEVSDGGLAIFTKTEYNMLNQQRAEDTFENTLYPVWDATLKELSRSDCFQFIYSGKVTDKFELSPQPLYGVDINQAMYSYQNDLKSTSEKGGKSAMIDITDALFVNFSFRINYKCI